MIKRDLFGNIVIKSISFDQYEIIENILDLHCNGGNIELDPTYSIGNFYNGRIKAPKYKFDINPQIEGVGKADSRNIPLPDESIKTIMFDPPFIFGNHGKMDTGINAIRFSKFKSYKELKDLYTGSLKEFYRLLNKRGTLIFKCQDFTDSKTTMVHCLVYNWAIEIGFYAKDLFIFVNKSRPIHKYKNQKHSRKFHSYFWVFKKMSNNRVGDFAL